MIIAKVEVESDGDFKYENLFSIVCHRDDEIIFNSVMENLLHIGESIESSKRDISDFKKVILDFTNAYFKEGKEEYVNHGRELYYNAKNNEIYFGLDWGNWSVYVEMGNVNVEPFGYGFKIITKE